jgi:hypothetical protein
MVVGSTTTEAISTLINYNKKNFTKWISWKEFAQTGPEKVCDKVIIKQT